ncbi:MAG: hypothetical protein CHACPFDD_00728 [Phycisphaerae bacterium]|nr:hypothetical protein [Phycisphaerae bacterium]
MIDFPSASQWTQLIRDELRQRREEGCDVAAMERTFERGGLGPRELSSLYAELSRLAPTADFPYREPSDLAGIHAERPAEGRVSVTPAIYEVLADRIHGGWLGRCCGCALGKPLEMPVFMRSAANVRKYLKAADAYPLADYVVNHPGACAAVGIDALICEASQRGRISFMESDDDLRYTIMGLDILERVGPDFSTRDVASWWLTYLPAARCFTAEEAAYRNLLLLGATHDCSTLSAAQLELVRGYLNPYREWIGAQIRADGWGLACPGDCQGAAEYAWRDASLSHVKNGIYGEMFCAAMIAAAAVLSDPLRIVRAGLAEIPQRSRLADAIRRTIARCEALRFDAARFEEAIDWLWDTFGDLDAVHTINNAAAVTAALLLGREDFGRVISIAVSCGWDPDCNGATAGCIAGAMLGASRLPASWTRPLNDTLMSEIPGFHPIKISDCAARHLAVAMARA